MGRFLVKLVDVEAGRDYYLEWSTIVDAPLTRGMTLGELKRYVRTEYGPEASKDLPERLVRVEEYGTSLNPPRTVPDAIGFNLAGKDGTQLSLDQIIERYCRNPDGPDLVGVDVWADNEARDG